MSEEIIDVSGFTAAKSDQINADDLIAGPIRVRIARVVMHKRAEQALEITLEGIPKVWRPCKTMGKVMSAVWGENAAKWCGECLELYRDPTTTWAGAAVGGIRISAVSKAGFEGRLNLTKGKKAPFVIRMFTPAEVAAIGQPQEQPPAVDDAADLADFRAAIKDLLASKATTKEAINGLLSDGGYQKLDDIPATMRRAFYDALTPEEAPAK